MFRRQTAAVCALVFLALLSNRWMGWSEGIAYLSASDVTDGYLPVAESAPALPVVPVPFHKAQRFVFPYLAGVVSKITGATLPITFDVDVAVLQVFLLLLFGALLSSYAVPPRRRILAFCLLVFQPYAFRYYWIVPGMLPDVAFSVGALLAVFGLVRRQGILCALGLAFAVLARQTTLLMLPGVMLWILAGPRWREVSRMHRCGWAAGLAGLTIALYGFTGNLAARLGDENQNAKVMFGLFEWLSGPAFSAKAFGEHTLRCVLPLLPAAALLVASPKLKQEALFLALMAAGIASQPFLAGPVLTGQNAARLVTLGLPFLVMAWACAEQEWARGRAVFLGLLLFLGSFHHLYTVIGPSAASGTALLQILVTLGAFAFAWGARSATAH